MGPSADQVEDDVIYADRGLNVANVRRFNGTLLRHVILPSAIPHLPNARYRRKSMCGAVKSLSRPDVGLGSNPDSQCPAGYVCSWE